jgi:hypothetical protein
VTLKPLRGSAIQPARYGYIEWSSPEEGEIDYSRDWKAV